jgi:hypothetical protein
MDTTRQNLIIYFFLDRRIESLAVVAVHKSLKSAVEHQSKERPLYFV